MTPRLKALLPLSVAAGLLAFLWLEVSLNDAAGVPLSV
ncbi:hypothetical protein NOCARDAX2BIS_160005 [Nocardioides sp. AX2bis]|nr:hypothetical protein NOCARDAX2BIS_160005 [Nocardioides sp. AX2bis]